MWKNIAKELKSADFYKYTWKQAEDKWKNLRKTNMKMKDNQKDKNSGAAKVTCKFYDKLDEIFRKSPSMKPISIAFSRNYKNFPSTSNILNIVSDEHSDILNIEFDENLKLQPKKN